MQTQDVAEKTYRFRETSGERELGKTVPEARHDDDDDDDILSIYDL